MATTLEYWRVETEDSQSGSVLNLVADQPGASVNVLSEAVLKEFETLLEDALNARPAGLVIRSAKVNGFFAGADISAFERVETAAMAVPYIEWVHAIFNRLEQAPFPTLALVHGFCLGGGLELALACRYRVAIDDPSTRIGLPEVKLGVQPGFGGSGRLVRLLGPVRAMPLMLSGRALSARSAKRLGVVDRAVPRRIADLAAVGMLAKAPPPRTAPRPHALLNARPAREILAPVFRREVAKQARAEHYPAPYAVIDLWRREGGDCESMVKAEIPSIAELLVSPTSRNLVRLFQLQESLKGLGRNDAPPIRHVHVVGAGTMGGDIAAWCALRGMQVTLQDLSADAIGAALGRAGKLFRKRLKTRVDQQAARDRLRGDPSGSGVAGADLVIEAVVERAEVKCELFQSLEAVLPADAIIATNTSSIPLAQLTPSLRMPGRLVGLHFFNPVARMQLVEVIATDETDPIAMALATAFVTAIDRLPLPVASSPGFLVNRVLTPYLLEALRLIEEGHSVTEVDAAAKAFGMPMGPAAVADQVGLDVCLSVAEVLDRELGFGVPDLLRKKIAEGQLGRKNGRGFYQYKKGKAVTEPYRGTPNKELEERMVLCLCNEAIRCLRENVVTEPAHLDAGLVFGAGFAPFRGGPLRYIESEGRDALRQRLAALAERHGERFAPDPGWSAQDAIEELEAVAG